MANMDKQGQGSGVQGNKPQQGTDKGMSKNDRDTQFIYFQF